MHKKVIKRKILLRNSKFLQTKEKEMMNQKLLFHLNLLIFRF